MTKVYMNEGLLDYQEMMKDTLRETIRQNFIGGVRQANPGQIPFASENLLPCPQIGLIFLEAYEGQGDDYIGITAGHDFGIYHMGITIRDDQGNLIERGDVYPHAHGPDLWEYLPEECVAAGTCVTVEVVATDCMGGVAVSRESKRLSRD